MSQYTGLTDRSEVLHALPEHARCVTDQRPEVVDGCLLVELLQQFGDSTLLPTHNCHIVWTTTKVYQVLNMIIYKCGLWMHAQEYEMWQYTNVP